MVINYTALVDACTDQIELAIPAALTVMGLYLGVQVGIRIFKRVV